MGIPRSSAPTDYVLASLVGALVGFGLVMVYSASFIFAQERTGDGYFFIKRQIAFAFAGGVAAFAAARVDARKWREWAPWILIGALAALVLVLLPGVGVRVGGAQRWLRLGLFSFQPSELAKVALVLYTARMLGRKREMLHSFKKGILPVVLPAFPVFALLLAQPDFGSTAILAAVIFGMLFAAGAPWKLLLAPVAGAAALGALLIATSPYRMARFASFLDPWKDPSGKGFQILQSLVGFHLGGFWGAGLGNGKEKLFFLPEAHNDFIFAVIGEELGFVGVVCVVAAFFAFVARGFRAAWGARYGTRDGFLFHAGVGITLAIGIQAFVNMAVVLGIVPTKGLTLPFVSYGGSALLLELAAVGILLGIARARGETEP